MMCMVMAIPVVGTGGNALNTLYEKSSRQWTIKVNLASFV